MLHARLLADAEAHVVAARFDVAERRLLAHWRLARSLLSSLGAGLSRFAFAFAVDAAVALRRLPSIDGDWGERLTSGAWRELTGDYLVIQAAGQFRFAEDVASVCKSAGARRLALDWLWHPLESRRLVEEARALLQLSAIVLDAERCGDAWSQPETHVSGTARSSLPRRLDALAAQLELTRKVAQAKRQRAADGTYPNAIDGFEAAECERLAWSYEGGSTLSITATGDAAAWYAGEKGWPPLEHREP